MNVSVQWTGGMQFVGRSASGHAVVMDASKEAGGDNTAASPMEMVLMGLAGCSGIDVVHILSKKRTAFEEMKIDIEAERRDRHPMVFSQVHVHFFFKGRELKEKPVQAAVDLSMEKYCSVAGMVSQTAGMTWDVELVSSEEDLDET